MSPMKPRPTSPSESVERTGEKLRDAQLNEADRVGRLEKKRSFEAADPDEAAAHESRGGSRHQRKRSRDAESRPDSNPRDEVLSDGAPADDKQPERATTPVGKDEEMQQTRTPESGKEDTTAAALTSPKNKRTRETESKSTEAEAEAGTPSTEPKYKKLRDDDNVGSELSQDDSSSSETPAPSASAALDNSTASTPSVMQEKDDSSTTTPSTTNNKVSADGKTADQSTSLSNTLPLGTFICVADHQLGPATLAMAVRALNKAVYEVSDVAAELLFKAAAELDSVAAGTASRSGSPSSNKASSIKAATASRSPSPSPSQPSPSHIKPRSSKAAPGSRASSPSPSSPSKNPADDTTQPATTVQPAATTQITNLPQPATATKNETSTEAFKASGFGNFAKASASPFGAAAISTGTSAFAAAGSSSSPWAAKPATPANQPSAFNNLGGSSGFGNTSTTSAFGGLGKPAAGSVFGGASAFGAVGGAKPSVFGSGAGIEGLSSKPAKAFGAADDEEDEEEDGDDEGEAEAEADEGTKSPVNVDADVKKDKRFYKQTITTGEEGETNIFQQVAKLYQFGTKEGGKGWLERGLGILKLNVVEEDDEDDDADDDEATVVAPDEDADETDNDDSAEIGEAGKAKIIDAPVVGEDAVASSASTNKPSGSRKIKARLIMRTKDTGNVILNTFIQKGVKFGDPAGAMPKDNKVYFMGNVPHAQGMQSLILKMQSEQAKNLWHAVQELQERL